MTYTRTDYRIVNPGAGDDYFEVDGTAYDAKGDFSDSKTPSEQPTVFSGSAKGLYSNRTLLNNVDHGFVKTVFASILVGGNNVGSAAWAASAISLTSVAASADGFAVFTESSHGLSAGDILNITDTNSEVNGPQRITAVTTNTFTTTKTYTSGAGTLTYYLYAGNFATMTAGSYVMRRVSTTLAGIANTVLRSGAADPTNRRSIHKAQQLYTYAVATAIRAGYWTPYNGAWSTAVTNTEEGYYGISGDTKVSTGAADEAANPSASKPGELVYKEPKPLPDQDDYKARTLW